MSRKSLFIDRVEIFASGGRGGNGASHFHREKFVPLGGPDGGDGGNGGSVILDTDPNLSTLLDFSFHQTFKAQDGEPGRGNNCYGRFGQDVHVRVPVGTMVLDREGRLLADLHSSGQSYIAAHGGRGGRGNTHFSTALRRSPTLAEKGQPGEEKQLILELKLLADVGLLGKPNAGKSTLLANVSSARPKIADYPFTTLVPNLGLVRLNEGEHFVMVDIPGLIEGAAQGEGLGHDFLRHIERTRLLMHLVDIGFPGVDPEKDYALIMEELAAYNPRLLEKKQLVVLTKCDLAEAATIDTYRQAFEKKGLEVFAISASTHSGLTPLLRRTCDLLRGTPVPVFDIEPAPKRSAEQPRFRLEQLAEDRWALSGPEVEKWVAMTDFNNQEAVAKLRNIFDRLGVSERFIAVGIPRGATIQVGKEEFFFEPDELEQEPEVK